MVTSYNGWVASPSPAAIGVAPFTVNGVAFPSGVKAGDVATVFSYLVEQYTARVEPVINPGCWGYFYKQSANSAALLSCHSSGTAIDLNAPRHPNGKRGTFTGSQVAAIRVILAELGGVVYWGGDCWGNGTPDEMHFEIAEGASVAQVAGVASRLRSAPGPAAVPVAAAPAGSVTQVAHGQTSEAVKGLQRFLNAYNWRPVLPLLPVTGFYGDQTTAVLAKAQLQMGISGGDGRNVGPQTAAAIFARGGRF